MDEWYGYTHLDGFIHIKRFFDHEDIKECKESMFTVLTYGPFCAEDRADAVRMYKILGDQDGWKANG